MGIYRDCRGAAQVAAASLSLVLSGGCASGIAVVDPRPGAASAEVQALAQRADAGDKQAQLELGRRFRDGRDVPANIGAARKYLRMAAADSGGTHMMHVPADGNVRAATVPADSGPFQAGLPAGRAELAERNDRRREKRRTLTGVAAYAGSSNVCTTERAAVEASTELAVGTCEATAYRFSDPGRRTIDLIDLTLITSDEDAASALHIPFGLIDASEPGLYSDDDSPIQGKVTFGSVRGVRESINIIRSFKKRR